MNSSTQEINTEEKLRIYKNVSCKKHFRKKYLEDRTVGSTQEEQKKFRNYKKNFYETSTSLKNYRNDRVNGSTQEIYTKMKYKQIRNFP